MSLTFKGSNKIGTYSSGVPAIFSDCMNVAM